MALLQPRRGLQESRLGYPKRRNRLRARKRNSTFRLEVSQVLGKAGTRL
jgi:hypothetical protein